MRGLFRDLIDIFIVGTLLCLLACAQPVFAQGDVAEWTSFVAFAEDEAPADDVPLISEGRKNRDKNKVVPPVPDDEPERPLVRPVIPKPVEPQPEPAKPKPRPQPDAVTPDLIPPVNPRPVLPDSLPGIDFDELTQPIVEKIEGAITGVLQRIYAALAVAVVALLGGVYVIVKVLK